MPHRSHRALSVVLPVSPVSTSTPRFIFQQRKACLSPKPSVDVVCICYSLCPATVEAFVTAQHQTRTHQGLTAMGRQAYLVPVSDNARARELWLTWSDKVSFRWSTRKHSHTVARRDRFPVVSKLPVKAVSSLAKLSTHNNALQKSCFIVPASF